MNNYTNPNEISRSRTLISINSNLYIYAFRIFDVLKLIDIYKN